MSSTLIRQTKAYSERSTMSIPARGITYYAAVFRKLLTNNHVDFCGIVILKGWTIWLQAIWLRTYSKDALCLVQWKMAPGILVWSTVTLLSAATYSTEDNKLTAVYLLSKRGKSGQDITGQTSNNLPLSPDALSDRLSCRNVDVIPRFVAR